MKHHEEHYTRKLAQSTASANHPSCLVCDHRPATKQISRGQSLVTQLRTIVLPALQPDERAELVSQLFQDILDCSSKAMAELQLHQFNAADARADDVQLVDDKKRVRKISPNDCTSKEEDVNKPHHQHKRRRFADSVSLETPVPHYDGRQWRKYGQKHINKANHPRSYYRCTYRQEQGCQATKTVQQQDDDTGADHSVMYTVIYHGNHTCKENNNGVNSGPVDSKTNTQSTGDLVSSDNQSSISVNCSDPCDDEKSQDHNKLLHKSADLITNDNIYEPLDMSTFAPLDFESWELEALLQFVA